MGSFYGNMSNDIKNSGPTIHFRQGARLDVQNIY